LKDEIYFIEQYNKSKNGMIEIIVKDSGIGIKDED
jgi:hypothetical protein